MGKPASSHKPTAITPVDPDQSSSGIDPPRPVAHSKPKKAKHAPSDTAPSSSHLIDPSAKSSKKQKRKRRTEDEVVADSLIAASPPKPSTEQPAAKKAKPSAASSMLGIPLSFGGQASATSTSSISKPKTSPKKAQKKPAKTFKDSVEGLSHVQILSEKWLSTEELKIVKQDLGVNVKSGKYTQVEDDLLQGAIQRYADEHNLSQSEITAIIFAKKKDRAEHPDFWPGLARKVEGRPLESVFHHVKRLHEDNGRQGKWSEDEVDLLEEAYAAHGTNWALVAAKVGRTAEDCRDKWKHYLHEDSAGRNTGLWTDAESSRLVKAVEKATKKVDIKNLDWNVISKLVGRRTRWQCRTKWATIVFKTDDANTEEATTADQSHKWTYKDKFLLVSKLYGTEFESAAAIPWEELKDDEWDYFDAPRQLRHQWNRLEKKARKAFAKEKNKNFTFSDLVEWNYKRLNVNRINSTKTGTSPTKFTKSQEFVDSEDDA